MSIVLAVQGIALTLFLVPGGQCARDLSTTPEASQTLFTMFTEGYFYYFQRQSVEGKAKAKVNNSLSTQICPLHAGT